MAIAAVLSAWSVSRMHTSARLESLVNGRAPASVALEHLLNDFGATDDLLVLVSVPESDRRSETERARELVKYAQRLDRAVRADAACAVMVRGVAWSVGTEPRKFVEEVVAPSGLYYLDDSQMAELRRRLTPEGMRARLQQDEARLAVPGPGADALAKVLAKDPLGLSELVSNSLAAMRPRWRTWRGGEDFVSPDAKAILIRVSATKPASDLEFTKHLMKRVRRAAAAARPGELRVNYAGAYAIAAYCERQTRGDMIADTIGAVIAMQVLFVLVYRSGVSFLLAFAPVAVGILIGFGVYGAATTELTPITAAVGAILAGIGIDYGIQYLSRYQAARSRGATKLEAADLSSGLGRSLGMACVTALVGFGAVAVSSVSGLRDFAVLAALCLAGAFVMTVVLLPAVLTWVDRGEGGEGARAMRLRVRPGRWAAWVSERSGWCIGVTGVVGAIAAGVVVYGAATRPWTQSDLAAMHPQPNPPLRTQERIGKLFAGSLDELIVLVRGDSSAELLARCRAVDERLGTAEFAAMGLSRPLSPATLLPDPRKAEERRNAFSGEEVKRIVADFRAAVAGSDFDPKMFEGYTVFLNKVLRPGDPPGLKEVANFPSVAGMLLPKDAVRGGAEAREALAVMFQDHAFADRAERDRMLDSVRGALADVKGATLTGMTVVGRDVEDSVRRDLPRVLGIAGLIVAGWIWVMLRSLRETVLVLLPAVFGMVWILAAMVWSGSGLNLVNMVSLPILLGVGVDNGIFLVGIAREAAGNGREVLVRELGTTCFAVVMCNTTAVLGFGSLWFASTPAVSSLGLVFTAGMAGCLLASMGLLTPMLLRRAERGER